MEEAEVEVEVEQVEERVVVKEVKEEVEEVEVKKQVEEEFHEDCGHSMFVFVVDSFECNYSSFL